jgi:hypothetical protein
MCGRKKPAQIDRLIRRDSARVLRAAAVAGRLAKKKAGGNTGGRRAGHSLF